MYTSIRIERAAPFYSAGDTFSYQTFAIDDIHNLARQRGPSFRYIYDQLRLSNAFLYWRLTWLRPLQSRLRKN